MTMPGLVSRNQTILQDRARLLARPLASRTASTFEIEMLAFGLGRERYAVESRFVFSVFQLVDFVPLPGARAPVFGLTRWRGDILTLIDLRGLVGGATHALDDLARVIVLGDSGPEFGLLADFVEEMVLLDPTKLFPAPSKREAGGAGVILGVTAQGLQVLDATALIVHQTGRPSQPHSD
ncbi:MAG: chemotaxis protein CheW [Gemmatimonadales bacterium]